MSPSSYDAGAGPSRGRTATSLRLSMSDLRRFISPDNPAFVPPDGSQQLKDLNLLMGAVFIIRVFDEQHRRTRQELWDAMEALREQVRRFGDGSGDTNDLREAGMALCMEVANESEKLCPVPLESVKVLLLTLADVGAVRPPKMSFPREARETILKQARERGVVGADSKDDDDTMQAIYNDYFRHEILNARAVLYSVGNQLGKALASKEKKDGEDENDCEEDKVDGETD